MKLFFFNTKGFTLLETLVATLILSFVIIGPLAAIVNSSSYARKAKDTMAATYLAEGTIELLQNQYDSIYVYCRKQPDTPMCAPLATVPNESSANIAWRIFKDRFTATSSQPSCFADNPDGCAFDSLSMIGDITVVPTRYVASSPECASIVDVAIPVVSTTSPVNTQVGGLTQISTTTVMRHAYRCSGVTANIPVNATSSAKTFKRRVSLERIAAPFEAGLPVEQQYNDDIRIVSNVEFKAFGNSTSSVKITRFMHAHQ
jgi:type II secretory pathway pseudopilin PulG